MNSGSASEQNFMLFSLARRKREIIGKQPYFLHSEHKKSKYNLLIFIKNYLLSKLLMSFIIIIIIIRVSGFNKKQKV